MNTVLHKSESRGQADHGWLKAKHSFSFANYYNPEKINFGALRVLNDDHVEGGMGFGKHPHDNMEIITIPLSGDLEHQDSMGHTEVIKSGEVQVMSAGTGITHSEYNANQDEEVKLLQIWVIPNQRMVTPRYEQIAIDPAKLKNNLLQIVSPNKEDEGAWIHQNAWFHLGNIDKGQIIDYKFKKSDNGVYAFLIEGEATIANQFLSKRDAVGITNTKNFNISTSADSKILLIEVPMR
ncbi:MAG: pirin family protein [Reichenbachiella sp.]